EATPCRFDSGSGHHTTQIKSTRLFAINLRSSKRLQQVPASRTLPLLSLARLPASKLYLPHTEPFGGFGSLPAGLYFVTPFRPRLIFLLPPDFSGWRAGAIISAYGKYRDLVQAFPALNKTRSAICLETC